jgi:hypothetical protein
LNPFPLINEPKKFILFTNGKCGGTSLKSWFVASLDLGTALDGVLATVKTYGVTRALEWFLPVREFPGSLPIRIFDALKELHPTLRVRDDLAIRKSDKYLRRFIEVHRRATTEELDAYLNRPDWYQFAVVRNPLDRLVSGYVDKFCKGDANEAFVKDVVDSVDKRRPDSLGTLTFSEFVDHLASSDITRVDPHWRPQSQILDGVRIDKFIKLEELASELVPLSERFGVVPQAIETRHRQSNSYANNIDASPLPVFGLTNIELREYKRVHGAFPRHTNFYDDVLRDKVREIYRSDFELLTFY